MFMKPKHPLAIYVATEKDGKDVIERWNQHPAFAPTNYLKSHTVSTAAGDVELRFPHHMPRDISRLGRAYREVEKMHPQPDDIERIDSMTSAEERLNFALKLALEYIERAEDGGGHNARSRHIAQCLRHLREDTSDNCP